MPGTTPSVSSYIHSFEVVGKGSNIDSEGRIVVDGGWGVASTLDGAVLLRLHKSLRNCRIQIEFRGYCETRWDAPLRLATRPITDNYKPQTSGRLFQQIVDIVYESSESLNPNPVGGPLVFPFQLNLPGNGLPPSYETVHGSISYYIKCTILTAEGMKLLKSSYEATVPCTIYMPDSAKIKLIESPSQIVQQHPGNNEKAAYSLSLPRRILFMGETLEVNLAIFSTPGDTRLRSFNVSMRTVASYISGDNTGAQAPTPRPLSEMSQSFPLIKIGGPGGNESLIHRLFLEVDSEIAQPSIESALISVKTVLRMEIILDNSETPNQHYELPVVVVPLLKQSPAMNNPADLRVLQKSKSLAPLQTRQSNDKYWAPATSTSTSRSTESQ
ncbi:UNVERIFIED_CONTAM: hypothetical protein HDU68_006135 [Siphonaria sp. JEL0065]|nr:hypothetical protein HDU68_006135 [Siphonaria sp. JEL0065]